VSRLCAAFVVFVVLANPAIAEQRTLYDAGGRVIGRAATDSQGSTTFYDPAGRVTGRSSTTPSGTTTFYDPSGRSVGKASGKK
jgi:YD repeat-containing protein